MRLVYHRTWFTDIEMKCMMHPEYMYILCTHCMEICHVHDVQRVIYEKFIVVHARMTFKLVIVGEVDNTLENFKTNLIFLLNTPIGLRS